MIRVNSPRAAIVSMVALLVGAAMVAPAFAASPTTPAAPLSNGTNAPPPVPAPIIMIIDYEGIIAVSKAGKSISAQIDTQRTAMQKDLAQRENDLRTEQGDLEKQHATMQQDAFEAKAREFQQKVAAYQRDAQLRERALGQGVNDAKQKLTEALTEVVQQLAGERGANLVLYKTQVPLYETSYDASQEALKRLDIKLPNLALVIPKPSEVAGGQPAPAPAAAASASGTATKAAAPAAAPAKKK